MTDFILLIIAALAGYLLAEVIYRRPYTFKVSEKMNVPHISENRINEILLQENHGEDIDAVVDHVKKGNPLLPFTLKD